MPRTYNLTEDEALRAFKCIADHCATLKNLVVSAVERGDLTEAKRLAGDLRLHQATFAKLNVEAHRAFDSRKSGGSSA